MIYYWHCAKHFGKSFRWCVTACLFVDVCCYVIAKCRFVPTAWLQSRMDQSLSIPMSTPPANNIESVCTAPSASSTHIQHQVLLSRRGVRQINWRTERSRYGLCVQFECISHRLDFRSTLNSKTYHKFPASTSKIDKCSLPYLVESGNPLLGRVLIYQQRKLRSKKLQNFIF